MAHPKFEEGELKVVQEVPGFTGEMLPIYDFPVSMRQSVVDTYKGNPCLLYTSYCWAPSWYPGT